MESVLQSFTFVMLRIHVAQGFPNRMLRKDVGENRKALAELCASKTKIIIHYPLHYSLSINEKPLIIWLDVELSYSSRSKG